MKYNQTNKNKVRSKIINLIEQYNIKSILTLESKDFLFSKSIPQKKVIVFENNKEEYRKMKKNKPQNVNLFEGNISRFQELGGQADCVYLDFCRHFIYEKETIFNLKESIRNCKLFGLTFALRQGIETKKLINQDYGDYQFYLIRKLTELLELNLKVLYGESYRDSSGMITIFFENLNKQGGKINGI